MAILVYTDLTLLTIIPIILQSLAFVYLYKVHRLLGARVSRIFVRMNITSFLYIAIIIYLLTLASDRPGNQQIEIWGLWLAFIFPIANSGLHFLLKKILVDTLLGKR